MLWRSTRTSSLNHILAGTHVQTRPLIEEVDHTKLRRLYMTLGEATGLDTKG